MSRQNRFLGSDARRVAIEPATKGYPPATSSAGHVADACDRGTIAAAAERANQSIDDETATIYLASRQSEPRFVAMENAGYRRLSMQPAAQDITRGQRDPDRRGWSADEQNRENLKGRTRHG